ncbi:MAG TPA: hypothetical protein DCZ08_11665 [Anaerolineaceae bacterium]|nr:hypothetical protein [Anaerolineaceae bacterium]
MNPIWKAAPPEALAASTVKDSMPSSPALSASTAPRLPWCEVTDERKLPTYKACGSRLPASSRAALMAL